ncbi:MAG: hypothetical protein WAV82_02865 [Methylobacter sp.]
MYKKKIGGNTAFASTTNGVRWADGDAFDVEIVDYHWGEKT